MCAEYKGLSKEIFEQLAGSYRPLATAVTILPDNIDTNCLQNQEFLTYLRENCEKIAKIGSGHYGNLYIPNLGG